MLITVLQPVESGRSHVYSHVTTNIQFSIGNNATLESIQASISCLPQKGSTKFAISWRKHDKQMTSPQRWASLVAVVLPHSFGCVAGPAVRSVRFFGVLWLWLAAAYTLWFRPTAYELLTGGTVGVCWRREARSGRQLLKINTSGWFWYRPDALYFFGVKRGFQPPRSHVI